MTNKKKILIIDDDPNLVSFMTMLLEDNGYDTLTAAEGGAGLEQTRSERPDLVILDISMPETSGVRYYRDVRDDPELKNIPVVMVTGITGYGGDKEAFRRFISKRGQVPPPDDFFSKPVDKEKLLASIAKLLS